jgi:hypothetical protein
MDIRVACLCPAKGHPEGDTVVLRDKLGFHEALTIRKAIALSREDADTGSERALAAEILATLSEFYVLMGVESWTIQDAKGEPLPVTKTNIRGVLMESPDIELVIEAADTIYNEAILLPLLLRANPSSPPTPTPSAEPGSSTSATESPTKPQKPSRPSSTTTSRTDGIETITSLPVGGSSSSQSSRSAA